MLKRHEIKVLRKAGHNASEVATLAGVSRRSVHRVEAEVAVTHVDTAAEIERRGVGSKRLNPADDSLRGRMTLVGGIRQLRPTSHNSPSVAKGRSYVIPLRAGLTSFWLPVERALRSWPPPRRG